MITRVIVIGGFAFNCKPLEFLQQLNWAKLNVAPAFDFVDINLFKAPFTLDDIVNFIVNPWEKIGPEYNNNCMTNNILIGYSTGGLVANAIGLKHPNLVKQIILINSTAKFIKDNHWNGITHDDFKGLLDKLNTTDLAQFMHYFTRLTAYPQKIKFNSYSNWYSNNNKDTLKNLLEIIFYADFRQDLIKLKDKLTLINSLDDALVKKNELPVRQIMLDNSSHLILKQNLLISVLEKLLHSNGDR